MLFRWVSILLIIGCAGCLTRVPTPTEPVALTPASTAVLLPMAVVLGEPAPAETAPDALDEAVEGEALSAEAPAEEAAVDEAVVEEPLDAETLADNQVLLGADQNPPEVEGQVVPLADPVFDFPIVENDKVRYFLDYFSGPARKTFTLWLERSSRYLPMMREEFAAAGLPRDLAYLAMVESGFNDKAYSWAHAVGPWQFIESTGRRYGLKNDWWWDERRDPVKSTRAAARYLGDLHQRFDGDWYLAVAAYNAGPGKISRAVKKYDTRDFWEICHGSYLQKETKNYVPKLLAALLIAKQPEKYGFSELDYHPPLSGETAILPTSTDLDVVARLCEVDYETIKRLNPELKRWSTPPAVKDYEVRLPAGTGERFVASYLELPVAQRASYVRHKVKSGDTVLALAKRYGVRTDDILRLNKIKNTRSIQIGTNLVVPLNPGAGRRPLAELGDDYKRSRRQTYTVRNGDSLWSISQRFNVSEKELRVWNRLGWSNVIRPGQTLVVSSKAAVKQKTAKVEAPQGPVRKLVYKVRPGDTLWGIGQQFAVDAGQIRDWNNLAQDHVLRPGDQLTLMVRGTSRG